MDGRPNVVAPPLAAARELLGDKFDDSGATSAVHPYGSAEVSFPRGLRALVDVVQALGREYAHVLGPETMLRECDELLDPPGMYLDETFRKDGAVLEAFVAGLLRLGLLGAIPRATNFASPFFVWRRRISRSG